MQFINDLLTKSALPLTKLLRSYASLIVIYFQILSLEGNMCYSGSGGGTAAEPIAAVSMNDDLQSARASVAKAEAEILSMLTEKVIEYIYFKLEFYIFPSYCFLLVDIFFNLLQANRCKLIFMKLKWC